MIDSLKGLARSEFVRLACLIAFVACPGFAWLFTFDRDGFLAMDFGKVLMLGLAISSPVFLVNCVAAYFHDYMTNPRPHMPARMRAQFAIRGKDKEKILKDELEAEEVEKDMSFSTMFGFAGAIGLIPLYAPLAFHRWLSLFGAIGVMALLEGVLLCFLVWRSLYVFHHPPKDDILG